MSQKSKDALLRSDRVLVVALAIVLAAVSAAVGAAAAYRPHTEQLKTTVVVAKAAALATPMRRRDRSGNGTAGGQIGWSKSSS